VSTKKNIIVVAPDKYKKLGRILAHEITNKDHYDGVYWPIKTYKDNEFKHTGNQYVIFIGNPDENEFTTDYVDVVKPKNRAGHCFGYNGSKALIYGEGNLDFLEESKKYWAKLVVVPIVPGLVFSPLFLGVFAQPIIGGILYQYYSYRKKKNFLLKNQTKAAIKSFLIHDFDDWLGIKPKNTSNSNE